MREVGKFIGMFMWWAVDELRQHRFTFKELVEAILRGSRRELQERGEISAVVGQLTGPTDEYDEQEELYKKEIGQFWVDDVTGTELLAHLVKMAREGAGLAPQRGQKGMKPLQLKLLDTNKEDAGEESLGGEGDKEGEERRGEVASRGDVRGDPLVGGCEPAVELVHDG